MGFYFFENISSSFHLNTYDRWMYLKTKENSRLIDIDSGKTIIKSKLCKR